MAAGRLKCLKLDEEPERPSRPLRVYYRKRFRKLECHHHVPEELMIEILKRLPVKSLLQLMCVSKSWCSLISSHTFISAHSSYQSDQTVKSNPTLTLYGVGSRFFMHPLNEPLDKYAELGSPVNNKGILVGYCHGVLCLFDYFSKVVEPLTLWNPSIGKAVTLPLPVPSSSTPGLTNVNDGSLNFTFGFGYDPISSDYKVVRVVYHWRHESNKTDLHTDIFSLREGSWRNIVTVVEGCKFLLECRGVCLNGILHWMCKRKVGRDVICKTLMTFNLADEKFGEIDLPLGLFQLSPKLIGALMTVRMVEDKLAVSCGDSGGNVWVLEEYGNSKSWRKLLNIFVGDNLGFIKGVMFTGDGKTVLTTSAGNWISWDPIGVKIVNLTLPTLDPDYVTAYVPSLVLLRTNCRALRCKELCLVKKKKYGERTSAREFRNRMQMIKLSQDGYLS